MLISSAQMFFAGVILVAISLDEPQSHFFSKLALGGFYGYFFGLAFVKFREYARISKFRPILEGIIIAMDFRTSEKFKQLDKRLNNNEGG